jgi:ATP-binding cassette subfamily B (MDR/TAP) protein 1
MYLEILSEIKNGFCRESIFAGFFFGLSQFINFAAFATLFYAGGKFMVNDGLSFDRLTRSIMTILFAAFGAGMAQQHAGDYGKASNAFNSLFSIVNSHSLIDTKVEENENKISAQNIKGKIEFRNVTFAYPSRPTTSILKNISFAILPGQSVAFVGPSGNGKSTIIQLIERFYDVTEGVILIDDVDIKDYNLLELRRKVGLVMQEPCLFKRDVKENIRYGNLNATDDEIFQAAEKANIQKFFTKDDQGTKDTPVSGGEKQRIAIARTFLKNPTIMLLDEATSALDKESEVEVQKSLDKLLEGKTSITIAHRLSTIEKCDVIYVLDHGCIVEQGNHQELYEKRGRYYTLHKYSSK